MSRATRRSRRVRAPALATALAALAVLAAPTGAGAATDYVIRGGGFGHGVGMSQYGAYGMAERGIAHPEILRHFYRGTELGSVEAGRTIRVLLQDDPFVRLRGATSVDGRTVPAARTLKVEPGAGGLVLVGRRGRRTALGPVATVSGPDAVQLLGASQNDVTDGTYRGVIELHASGAGVAAVNSLRLEDYVRGVVAGESPPSWPTEALRAQAIAARTYAITSGVGSDVFDQYADTRSQVYQGVAGETAATDAAVAATAGRVVTYDGEPVTTFFFSTSGGRTENVEDSVLGDSPLPWLVSVSDPYDVVSPRHRWGPIREPDASTKRRLDGLVKGSLRGIEISRRGRSGRVLEAEIVGGGGRTAVDGVTLQDAFDLDDTLFFITRITTDVVGPRNARAIAGSIAPASPGGKIGIERQARSRGPWKRVASPRLAWRGSYRVRVGAGRYRVTYAGKAGPAVRVGEPRRRRARPR